MAERARCPLCEAHCGDDYQRLTHILRRHAGRPVLGALPLKVFGPRPRHAGEQRMVRCWCGGNFLASPAPNRYSLAEHWREEGGVASHLVAVILGVCGQTA